MDGWRTLTSFMGGGGGGVRHGKKGALYNSLGAEERSKKVNLLFYYSLSTVLHMIRRYCAQSEVSGTHTPPSDFRECHHENLRFVVM